MVSRREFLGIATAAVAMLRRRDTLAAPALPGRLQAGFSLYGMKTLTFPEALRLCAEVGYGGVELALLPGYVTDPARNNAAQRHVLKAQLEEQSLDVQACMENLPILGNNVDPASHAQRLRAAFQFSRDVSPATTPIIETILGGKAGDWPKVRSQVLDTLGSWERLARESDAVIAIKPHIAHALQSPVETARLLKEIDSPHLRACFDYSHFERQQISMADAIAHILPYSVFMHVKDNVVRDGKTEFGLPGEGPTNYVALLSAVKAAGYRGAVCVEVSSQIFNRSGYDPAAAAQKSWTALRPAMEKAGIVARV